MRMDIRGAVVVLGSIAALAGCQTGSIAGGTSGCLPACSGTQVCQGGECVDLPSHCSDQVQSGDEAGVDCGGADCVACGGTCSDGIQNGDETGVDCGGSCGACAPTCSDGVQNGTETGVDCGGSCTACPPTCSDGIQNGSETGVDCGGNCNPCPATCSDSIQNANETDLDCGGGTCTACADGELCVLPRDCQNLVCGTDNVCTTPPCQCQPATCIDGVQNQGETDLDCGGQACRSSVPAYLCSDGAACAVPDDCESGVCDVVCQTPSCFDGVQNEGEGDVDCGGPCTACGDGATCSISDDCLSGVCGVGNACAAQPCICQTPSCGDGVKNGSEACDGADFGGATCADYGSSGGTLACAIACDSIDNSSCTGYCGDAVKDGNEQCDGADLGGIDCAGLGLSGTGLACTPSCTYDTSACGAAVDCPPCPVGAACSGSPDYTCDCPIFTTPCGAAPGSCTSLLTDPENCGACGNVCPAGTACSSGACMITCQTPLVKCDRACVDILTNSEHCGGCPGVDCTLAGEVCSDGKCVTPVATTLTPDKCAGGGPPIDLNAGTATPPLPPLQSCADDLASVSFRWALCSCKDINLNQKLFTDGFDSREGPYAPTCEGKGVVQCTQSGLWDSAQCTTDPNGDGLFTCVGRKGAGIGANGLYANNQVTVDWGALWWASAATPGLGTVSVEQDILAGGDLPGTDYGRGDAYVTRNVTATGTLEGALHIPTTSTVNSGFHAQKPTVYEPVTVAPPCDCASTNLVPVVDIINAHACTHPGAVGAAKCDGDANDNVAAGLDPDVLVAGGGRIDLPCGHYYFSKIYVSSDTTVFVHGNTAVYVGGSVQATNGSAIAFQLDDSSTLDIFVEGGVCKTALKVGSPSYPARTRMYIAGGNVLGGGSGTTCSGSPDRAMDLKDLKAAANFYAPWGTLYTPQNVLIYGSLFTGDYQISQQTTIHFDTAIAAQQNQCTPVEPPATTGCTSCRDCNNQACIGGACGSCSSNADCCAPLVCMFGTCVLY